MKKIVTLMICMLLILTVSGCSKAAKKPFAKTNQPKSRPVVVGYYANDVGGYDSLTSLKAHRNLLNEIHPLWYHVNPDGSLEKELNYQAQQWGRKEGI